MSEYLKQRASLKKQKKNVKAKRIWKEKSIQIKYDELLDGRVAKKKKT